MQKRTPDEAVIRAQAELIKAKAQKVDAYGRALKSAAEPLKALAPFVYFALVVFIALWARDFLIWAFYLGGGTLAVWLAKTMYGLYRHRQALGWAANDREPALPGTELADNEGGNNG